MSAAAAALTLLLVPQASYFKTTEPINIKVVAPAAPTTAPSDQKLVIPSDKLLQLGWQGPALFPSLYQSGWATVQTEQGDSLKVAPLGGAPLTPAGKLTPNAEGYADLAAIYPQMRKGGAFIVTVPGAQPLVVNTIYNPGRGPNEIKQIAQDPQFLAIPEAQKKKILRQFEPTVTTVAPLEYAVISTSAGDITVTFAYDKAPYTINNFVTLAKGGFYNNSAFHRIMKGFMAQGGDSMAMDPEMAGTGGPGHQIMAEFSDMKHERGVLSMARSQDPNSAGSQFFLMHQANAGLDGQYTAFGRITSGIEVVDKLAETPAEAGSGSVAVAQRPKLNSIKVLPAKAEDYQPK